MGPYFVMVTSRRKLDFSEKDFAAQGNPDGFLGVLTSELMDLYMTAKSGRDKLAGPKPKSKECAMCLSTDM